MAVIDDILKEFSTVSKQTWTELFLKEAKQDGLRTNESIFGFRYLPFYTSNAYLKDQAITITPLIAAKGKGWNVMREFNTENPVEQNKQILASLEKGTSSITLAGEINDIKHLTALLKGVLANHIEINFKNNTNPLELAKLYKQWCEANKQDAKLVFGTIYFDPIGDALKNGKWNVSKEKDFKLLNDTFAFVSKNFAKLKCLSVDAGVYHYGGASLTQTLSNTISHALEYVNFLHTNKIPVTEIHKRLTFNWPVGIHLFGEIAVIRALHLCWTNLINHIAKTENELFPAHIHAETSVFFWSGKDAHTNLLRSTTQVMAAVAGGANSIYVLPFNVLNAIDDNSAQRISTNVQLLLLDESFMDKVVDPAGGSFLVENLTNQFATNAIGQIKETELDGGFLSQIESGNIQELIKANSTKLTEAFKTNKLKIVGSNVFPNLKEAGKVTRLDFFGPAKTKSDLEPVHQFILDSN
jgi:methylmalonyl-CoA mutase